MNFKHFGALLLSLALITPALAADFKTGSFELYDQPHHKVDSFCDHGTKLVLDKAEVQGNMAHMENYLRGACEIFVPPNPRTYKITSVKDDGCGSRIYKGTYQDNRGVGAVEIIDNRGRTCENVIAALVVVTESGPDGSHIMYSRDH